MATVAFFVSPHGFGHAARACAVIDAMVTRQPSIRTHILTTVPEWFFAESLSAGFSYHRCPNDIGLIQVTPLEEDLQATVAALNEAPWRESATVDTCARGLGELGCSLVLADISPLGLCVARRAGLPSVLVENFTWDWVYGRLGGPDELDLVGDELSPIFASADLRIQTTPACRRVEGAVSVGPVARLPRRPPGEVRRHLGIPCDEPMVLASMGGVGWDYGRLHNLAAGHGPWVVVPGGAVSEERRGRLVMLPFRSEHFHPDLVHASDVVVGKLGYSTVAETVHAGAAFAYVERSGFPESPVLADFVESRLTAARLDRDAFAAGDWMPVVEDLLARERRHPEVKVGADEAARAIIERFPEVFG